MHEFSLKQLEVFACVAEQESFTKAAQVLYLTQSTVSAHIMALEQYLKTELFIRDGRRIRLTVAGQKLYPQVKKILAECALLADSIVREEENEPLALGASTVPGQYVLPEAMAHYLRHNPTCRYSLRKGDSSDIHRWMLGGEIHIGFVGSKLEPETMEYYPIEEDNLVMVTPNNEYFQNKKKCGAYGKDLLTERTVAREEGSGTDREIQNYMARKEIDTKNLQIIARVDDPETVKRMVAEGVGVSILSSLAVRHEVESGQLLSFEMDEEKLMRQIYLIVRRGASLTTTEQKFIKFFKNRKKM